jgi:hypothetical protein
MSRRDETRTGLRQALVMLLLGASLAGLAGLIWTLAVGGPFFRRASVSGMIVAGLLVLTGSDYLSRQTTLRSRAFLGVGPEVGPEYTGRYLTPLGTVLFVAAPLALIASSLYTL